jgi:hypothetical protein
VTTAFGDALQGPTALQEPKRRNTIATPHLLR